MARDRTTAPRRRRPVDGRRATDGVGVHGDPCPGDVDTVGRDMAHGVGLDRRVGAGMAADPARVGSWTVLLPAVRPVPCAGPHRRPRWSSRPGGWLLVAEADVDICHGGSPMAECQQLGLAQVRGALLHTGSHYRWAM
jgi:hypothetical protein